MDLSDKDALIELRFAKERVEKDGLTNLDAKLGRMRAVNRAIEDSGLSYERIGEVLGISRERVRQINRDYRRILKEAID